MTDVSSKFTDGLPHQLEQDLRCKLWGMSDPAQHKKKPPTDELFVAPDTGDVSKIMLE